MPEPDEPSPRPASTRWSRGANSTDDLSFHLLEVARSASEAALESYFSDDSDRLLWAAVSCGLAVEATMKYALSLVNPLLLADRSASPAVMLAFAGAGSALPRYADLRTANIDAILKLVRALHPGMASVGECDQVFGVRNAAIHMGLVDKDELELAATNMVFLVDGMLKTLNTGGFSFWFNKSSVVEKMLGNRTDLLRSRVSAKKAAARREMGRLLGRVNVEDLDNYFSLMETTNLSILTEDPGVLFRCPVCKKTGALLAGAVEADSAYDDANGSYFMKRTGYPVGFRCPVCQLTLDASEVGVTAGFPKRVTLTDLLVWGPNDVPNDFADNPLFPTDNDKEG
jgi:hypothetical protein